MNNQFISVAPQEHLAEHHAVRILDLKMALEHAVVKGRKIPFSRLNKIDNLGAPLKVKDISSVLWQLF